MQESMTIGRLADAVGVNVETVRYYQRRGLIAEPPRPEGGRRRYGLREVAQLAFIRRAQQLGFSLEEVKGLMQFSDGRSPARTRAIAERKAEVLEARVQALQAMRRRLRSLIARSRKVGSRGACPIIAALGAPD